MRCELLGWDVRDISLVKTQKLQDFIGEILLSQRSYTIYIYDFC